jgi:hypothetical protein
MMVYLANALIHGSSAFKARTFWKEASNHAEFQRQYLLSLVHKNTSTDFGKAHGFAKIKSIEDFQNQLPLSSFEYFEPWIRRLMDGEQNQLTADQVTKLEPTSGTSSGTKLIPYTSALQQEFMQGVQPWLADLYSSFPRIKMGTSYWSISPLELNSHQEKSQIPIGFEDDSEYFGLLGGLLRKIYPVPQAVRHLGSIENFRYFTSLCLLVSHNLSLISVWNPSFLTILLDYMLRNKDLLIQSIASGRLDWPDPAQVQKPPLNALKINADTGRARDLRTAFTGPLCFEKIWPRLQIISCWTSAQSKSLVEPLRTMFPDVRIQGKGLLATEGMISFPIEAAGGSVLAYRSHFFEFLDQQSGEVFLSHQLKSGRRYEVVITTGGGLYRYRLGDVVEVLSFYRGLPLIEFLGRNRTSDLAGEKLSEIFVEKVMDQIFSKESPEFYLLAGVQTDQTYGYRLFVNRLPEGLKEDQVSRHLEALLSENYHYAYARKAGQLSLSALEIVGSDAEVKFQEFRIAGGMKMGDVKAVHLYTKRDIRSCFPHMTRLHQKK